MSQTTALGCLTPHCHSWREPHPRLLGDAGQTRVPTDVTPMIVGQAAGRRTKDLHAGAPPAFAWSGHRGHRTECAIQNAPSARIEGAQIGTSGCVPGAERHIPAEQGIDRRSAVGDVAAQSGQRNLGLSRHEVPDGSPPLSRWASVALADVQQTCVSWDRPRTVNPPEPPSNPGRFSLSARRAPRERPGLRHHRRGPPRLPRQRAVGRRSHHRALESGARQRQGSVTLRQLESLIRPSTAPGRPGLPERTRPAN